MIKTTLMALAISGLVALASAQTQLPSTEKFYGKITSIDNAAKTFSVHNKSRKADATFAWTEQTLFVSSKQSIPASQLKSGDFLVVSFRENNGRKEAQKVVLRANSKKKVAE